MLHVLVDANNFFMKNLFSYKAGMRKSQKLFEKEEQILEYSHLISNSLLSLIDRFENRVGIVLCFDYKTWRKQYYKEYKGTREYDDSINWDAYFKFLDSYCDELKSKHQFTISRIEGAEADDLIYLWSKKLNNLGNDCVIISEDKDLHQLVKNTDSNNFTIIYNNSFKTPKLFKHPNTNLNDDAYEIDILNASDILSRSRSSLSKLIREVDGVEDIDVQKFIITKILTGDDGDNVPSVLNWVDSKGKNKRITPSVADKIYANFISMNEKPLYMLYNDFEFFKNMLMESIKFITGIKDDKLEEYVTRNCKLMCLHFKFIPPGIIKKFQESFNERTLPVYEKDTFLHNTKYFQDSRFKVGKNDKMDSFFNSFSD